MKRDNFVTLDREKCKGCLLCLDVCPNSLFLVDDELNDNGYQPIKMVDWEYCLNCLDCYMVCPDNAFRMPQKVEAKWTGRVYWLGRQSQIVTNAWSGGINKLGKQIKSIIPAKKTEDKE